MSKTVKKHCSILNYLEDTDSELADIIRKLCIGRLFNPRKGSAGITFLRPDSDLLSQIKKAAYGDTPEEAVDIIKSLILLDHVESIDGFGNKNSDIPTALRKKLPIASVSDKVVLTNGAEISEDKHFNARNDRSNIAVYIISKNLVPTDGEDSSFGDKLPPKKSKKGGYDYSKIQQRRQLFEAVVDETVKSWSTDNNYGDRRDPAMEVLVGLCAHLKSVDKNTFECVLSLLSNDTLTTLAIVLQPYRDKGEFYIDQSTLDSFMKNTSFNDPASSLFSASVNPVTVYSKLLTAGVAKFKTAANQIHKIRQDIIDSVSKATIITDLLKVYNNVGNISIPLKRQNMVKADPKLALAEGELRVMSAILRDVCDGHLTREDLIGGRTSLYTKCNLNVPWVAASQSDVNNVSLAYFYSGVYSIVRSEAILYVPGLDLLGNGVSLENSDQIISDNILSLNKSMDLVNGSFYSKFYESREGMAKSFQELENYRED